MYSATYPSQCHRYDLAREKSLHCLLLNYAQAMPGLRRTHTVFN